MSTALTRAQQDFSKFITSPVATERIVQTLGKGKAQGFATSIVAMVQQNAKLAECDQVTIYTGALQGAVLNLSPSPQLGHFYLVPFNDKHRGCKVAQFQLSYKGYIQLAMRSGQYRKLNPFCVKQGELKGYDPIEERIDIEVIPDFKAREEAPTIGYGIYMELVNGFSKKMYWSYEKMLAHADRYSMAFNKADYEKLLAGKIPAKDKWKYSSFWYADFDVMALKTMIRQGLSKYGVFSIEMQNAFEADQSVTEADGSKQYVDFVDAEQISEEEKEEASGAEAVDVDTGEVFDGEAPAEGMPDWAKK